MAERNPCAAPAALAFIVAAGLSAAAHSQEGNLGFRVGLETAVGDYGGTRNLEDAYVPLSILREGERVAFRATVPYLRMEFADNASTDPSATYTESGLGDVTLGLTIYDVLESRDGSTVVDFTGKVKLPTADENRGLGTGEADYTAQGDIYRFLRRGLIAISVGYRFRGEPAGLVLEDSWFVSFGGLRHLTSRMSAGAFVDYRESSIPGAPAIRELTVPITRRLATGARLQVYMVKGFSDTTLDWGLGMSIGSTF